MDRRIERTRNSIYEAFGKLLEEMPFEKISINNIADCANINRSTFYLHFVDKYELFDSYMDKQMQDFYNYSEEIVDIHDTEKIYNTLNYIFAYFKDNKEFFNIMFRDDNAGFFKEKFRKVIYDVISTKLYDENKYDIQQQFQLQLRVSALVGTIEWWLENKMPLSIDEISSDIFDVFLKLESDFY